MNEGLYLSLAHTLRLSTRRILQETSRSRQAFCKRPRHDAPQIQWRRGTGFAYPLTPGIREVAAAAPCARFRTPRPEPRRTSTHPPALARISWYLREEGKMGG
jgi:hypothetical protein